MSTGRNGQTDRVGLQIYMVPRNHVLVVGAHLHHSANMIEQ